MPLCNLSPSSQLSVLLRRRWWRSCVRPWPRENPIKHQVEQGQGPGSGPLPSPSPSLSSSFWQGLPSQGASECSAIVSEAAMFTRL